VESDQLTPSGRLYSFSWKPADLLPILQVICVARPELTEQLRD
jgi:hypothetical protein